MDPGRLLPIHPASEMRSVFTFFLAGITGANSPALLVHGPKNTYHRIILHLRYNGSSHSLRALSDGTVEIS